MPRLNIEDADIANAELSASPSRMHDYDPSGYFDAVYANTHNGRLPSRTPTNQTNQTNQNRMSGYSPTTRSRPQSMVSPNNRSRPNSMLSPNARSRPNSMLSPNAARSRPHSMAHPGHEAVEEAEDYEEYDDLERGPTLETVPTRGIRSRQYSRSYSVISRADTRMEAMMMHYLDRHPTAMARINDHRLQHTHTVGSGKTPAALNDESMLPAFGGNKPYPPCLPDREEYVVEFDGHQDPRHAQNWPFKRKLAISAILCFHSFAATFASSVFSTAATGVEHRFHVGREVGTLGTSLFVLGYACGPVIFAPMSELYGRRLPLLFTAFAFGIFNIAVAVSKDLQTLMICRYFSGFFGSAPLAIVVACFADMYNNVTRGVAIALFSMVVINGPLLAPMIGGFIAKSSIGWRYNAYIPGFMAFTAGILVLFFLKETYGPVILVAKAAELRRLTHNWGIHAKQEEVEVDFKELATKNISRPFRILFTEPIVFMMTMYMAFVYGLLYLSLTAYSIVFSEKYHMSPGVAGLPYFGMILGVVIGLLVVVWENPRYAKKLRANDNIPVPEWRLPIAMVGGILFAGGLFWFGWTGYTGRIHWMAPTAAGLFLGFGIFTVFLQCLNYIVDCYLMFAASAVAANTVMRSLAGAVFPLFGYQMFTSMGIEWGCTLLGCVATVCGIFPFIFYFYGPRIRAKSKFAPNPDLQHARQQDVESRGVQDDTIMEEDEEKKEDDEKDEE